MKKITVLLTLTMTALLFGACQSVPKNIPADLTPSQLLQRGQDAFAEGNYAGAKAYFNTVIQRYGTDAKVYVEARYELGHTYLKQKDYKKAKVIFLEIIETFDNNPQAVYIIPAKYKKLSEIQLEEIEKNPQAASATASIK
ncbi:MAG: tetratricopeptide repeat protein [Treponema sp.]|nr:tetratricopeptide repeat protein [Treponema sp.]